MEDATLKRILNFNNTKVDYLWDKTIHRFFKEQVEKNPHKTALVFGELTLTYDELNKKSNQLASLLIEKGIGSDKIVAIMGNRSFEMIIAIMGVLKAGGAYLPIDPEYPEERVRYMLSDSNARILIRWQGKAGSLDFDGEEIYLDNVLLSEKKSVNLRNNTVKSCDLAYVIYTSGSTGMPKGVMIEHRAVVNFIKGITDLIDFSEGKTILALTSISFDIFVLETLLSLTRGLRIVIADENHQKNPRLLSKLIIKNCVEMVQMTPSRMQMLISDHKSAGCLRGLKEIMIGGEAFPQALLRKIKDLTCARIYNMYGPTETTVWSSVKDLTNQDNVSIGKPIANTRIYILDESNNLMSIGLNGELCIAGDGLARGYLNKPELTAQKFVPDFLVSGERMYRTGDIARWNPDGDIECEGRMDDQVKIRGYRIELGEIESFLLKHACIKQAVAIAKEDSDGNKYLCAYYVSEQGIDILDLRRYLSKKLPYYTIPDYFIRLESLPTMPNGKINRKELSVLNINFGPKAVIPMDGIQSAIASIWKEVLGVKTITIYDRFFDIGGNSMNIALVSSKLNDFFVINISLIELFSYPTIYDLSKYINMTMNNGECKRGSFAERHKESNKKGNDKKVYKK